MRKNTLKTMFGIQTETTEELKIETLQRLRTTHNKQQQKPYCSR